jgi:hypothetical protein
MSIDRTLTPIIARLYAENPAITTARAAELAHHELSQLRPHEARTFVYELTREAIKQKCRQYYGRQRRDALRHLRALAGADADSIGVHLQMKLPLPDVDFAPTLGEATVAILNRATAYLRQMEHTTGEQAKRLEALADALDAAGTLTGETDLTVGAATARGLLNWGSIAA